MIIGIIGCGVIGTEICRALGVDGFRSKLLLIDRHPDRAQHLAEATPAASAVFSLFDVIDQADLVVECASIQAARYLVERFDKGYGLDAAQYRRAG